MQLFIIWTNETITFQWLKNNDHLEITRLWNRVSHFLHPCPCRSFCRGYDLFSVSLARTFTTKDSTKVVNSAIISGFESFHRDFHASYLVIVLLSFFLWLFSKLKLIFFLINFKNCFFYFSVIILEIVITYSYLSIYWFKKL